MRLAVIPARGGSKRIPRKNIKVFAGKPMIAHAIDIAIASRSFDRIVVSTDDAEIRQASIAAGAEVPFERPASLSDDHTPTIPVIAHAISEIGKLGAYPDAVCCIYPSVPLLRPDDIKAAYDLLASSGCDYVFPVTAFPSAIQRALRRNEQGRVSPFTPEHVGTRTQDLEPAYHDAGQFYWGATAAWLGGESPLAVGRTIVLPAWRVVDIDTPEDWDRAEALYAALHPTGK
jgi:pseudaminic acid cytidylyltransferase